LDAPFTLKLAFPASVAQLGVRPHYITPFMTNKKNHYITPIYKRSQWQRWFELFKDSDSPLQPSFDEWLQDSKKTVEKHKAPGVVVHEVEVDIDQYLSWVRAGALPINGQTRQDFPVHIFDKQIKTTGVYHVA
jgi:hypothetical protein